jgi:hypothetical protein
MPFKFFKEIIQSVKEGVAEAKAEMAEEKAAEAVKKELNAARFDEIDPNEKFLTALGAPFRRIFVSDEDFYLCSISVPDEKKEEAGKYLLRDFDVDDRNSLLKMSITAQASVFGLLAMRLAEQGFDAPFLPLAQVIRELNAGNANIARWDSLLDQIATVGDFLERIKGFIENADASRIDEWNSFRATIEAFLINEADALDESALATIALWMSRLSYASILSAGLGHVDKDEAFSLLRPIVKVGLTRIDSWERMATLFLAGEKQDGTNNMVGRKLISMMVDRLRDPKGGIWATLNWPRSLDALGSGRL